jgi:Sulfotransferase domain
MFAEELVAAYPDAKIILTVRDDVEAWYKSVLDTQWSGKFIFGPPTTILQRIVQYVVPRPHVWPVLQRIYVHTPLGNFPTEGRKWYKEYNEKIRTLATGKQFLEYNVKEGWAPLCKFLELEVPEIAFPRVNDTKAWQDWVEGSKQQSILDLLAKAGKICVPVVLGSISLWYLGTRG